MWTEAVLKQAVSMRKRGFSSAQIGKTLGLTRNAVVGKLWRINNPKKKKIAPVRTIQKEPRTYSDDALTEKWADRKARLARERAA